MKRVFFFLQVIGLTVGLSSQAGATDVIVRAPDDLKSDLEAASLALQVAEDPDSQPRDVLAAARADYERLIGVLYSAGYYSPQIQIAADGQEIADLSLFAEVAKLDKIHIVVTPGPRFKFAQARVAPVVEGTQLPEGFREGQIARSDLIRDAAQTAIEGWRQAGHAKAALTGQVVTANHQNAALSVDLQTSPGPKLRFGSLVVPDDSRVRAKRIAQIGGLPEGMVFNPQTLDEVATRLRGTGAFSAVTLVEGDANSDGTIDVTAEVVDAKKRRYGLGAEYSNFDGATISGFWLHRNLLGGAERFRVEAEMSGLGGTTGGEDYRLGTTLARPATFGTDTTLLLGLEFEDRDDPNFQERSVQTSAVLERIVSDNLTVSAGLRLRWSQTNDDFGDRTMTHIFAPFTATWDTRDDDADATKGLYVSADITPLVGLSAQDGDGVWTSFDTRVYQAVGTRLVLAGRIQGGALFGAEADEVPGDLLFFSGGGGTVRGQPYQSLGVTTDDGDTVGGRGFAGLSLEARLRTTNKLGVVGFYDAGFISSDPSFGDDGAWHSGAGLGLRYETGLGPIRFDVAVPVDGDTGDGVQFYIGVGQAF